MKRRVARGLNIDPETRKLLDEVFPTSRPRATFYYDARLDPKQTEARGHPVYVSAPFVRIQIPGEKDFVSMPATSEHAQKFAPEWREFQDRGEPKTSLRAIPTIDPGVIRTLHEIGLHCVEDVAEAEITDAVPEPVIGVPDDFDGDLPETTGQLPRWMERWQMLARQYLMLKHYAETGQKPRVRLEAA